MRVDWSGEGLCFEVGNERLPGVRVILDEPAPLGTDRGHMPTELLLGALGGCVGMNAVALLRKRKQPLVRLAVLVDGEQATEWPKAFTEFDVTFEITWSAAPDDEVVDAMLDKAVHAYCPVGGTIESGTATVRHHRRDVFVDA
ncbi:MAG TPA: OsmC family protein [Microbacteriaceae bacterium]|nr:OsmC family protein [Microbacteriaceae bacterium]